MTLLRVVHISQSDIGGGAAKSAWRLHRGLVDAGVDSRMLVAEKFGDDDRVIAHRPPLRRQRVLRRWMRPGIRRLTSWPDRFVSLNLLPTGIIRAAEALEPHVVHLHWLGQETASIEEIGSVGRPVVWTLHDMWPFAGASHYEPEAADAVWRVGATAARDWRERSTWLRKARAWRATPFEFVTPSRWLARLLAESALFHGRRASVIPHALDLNRFRPCGHAQSRERLGLPPDRPVIGFGAVAGLQDPRKGGAALVEALNHLSPALLERRPVACVFGQSRPAVVPNAPVEWVWLGAIQDERLMPLVYSAMDVLVVPSVMDNFPQTGVEAQACGCPVVTFAATGMPEVIEDDRTGRLAAAGSVAALADGIGWVLADADRLESLGRAARQRAEDLWSPTAVVAAYRALYERVTGATVRAPGAAMAAVS